MDRGLHSQVRRSLSLIRLLDDRAIESSEDLGLCLGESQKVRDLGSQKSRSLAIKASAIVKDVDVIRLNAVAEASYLYKLVESEYSKSFREVVRLRAVKGREIAKQSEDSLAPAASVSTSARHPKGHVGPSSSRGARVSRSSQANGIKPAEVVKPQTSNSVPLRGTSVRKQQKSQQKAKTSRSRPVYCTCRDVSYGEMIACDNPKCSIEWYHLPCINLRRIPAGRWYCPLCRRK